jgi:protein-arginine kinase
MPGIKIPKINFQKIEFLPWQADDEKQDLFEKIRKKDNLNYRNEFKLIYFGKIKKAAAKYWN